jgi:hypothetical protein
LGSFFNFVVLHPLEDFRSKRDDLAIHQVWQDAEDSRDRIIHLTENPVIWPARFSSFEAQGSPVLRHQYFKKSAFLRGKTPKSALV